ncbi:MAG TPA: glucosyl-3-phosphoglycerate synthase [Solirubrobacteraceae bacterium]|jgi:glycosyltransferase involved in cell wall biosynthesis|nr:glucosyl-3-phosphoglycerate synthase [Solirubrobacteraceae bacterium]
MIETAAHNYLLPPPESTLRAVIVVPARDEQERIAACVAAVAEQRGVPSEQYELIVILDGCADETAEVAHSAAARRPGLRMHQIELDSAQGVGRARRLGMDLACERLLGLGREDGLIASTDADSVVAPDWLCEQLELLDAGAEAIGGRIELDGDESQQLAPGALAERDRAVAVRMQRALRLSAVPELAEHHQFSGASLALTAAAYARCGGLPVRAALEDEALEQALVGQGVAIHRSARVRVRTSARTSGRAPRGLARDLASADWRARRTYDAGEFTLGRLLEAKRATVVLLLPTREVAATIEPVAEAAARLRAAGLLDEAIVIDAASADGSAEIARRAGVRVVQENDLLTEFGPVRGKGDAMWRGLAASSSEIVVFADTDTEDFDERFLLGMLGPLLCDPGVQFVKGSFRRPFRSGAQVLADGGGRVTELMARPLLNLHAPELAVFDQPLAGETAARRELLEPLAFAAGYGVEIAMLIDVWRGVGLDAMAQVDLGVRQNRHQPLRDLSAMAYAVLVAAQTRFLGQGFADANAAASIALPPPLGERTMESRGVALEERPPLSSLTASAVRSA